MLVLRRKLQERITIGPDVVIEVVDIGHGYVRLGITAPKDVIVDREEINVKRDRAEGGRS